MITLVSPNFFKNMPSAIHPLLDSGILLAALVSVTLNLFFNGLSNIDEARSQATLAAASVEHA